MKKIGGILLVMLLVLPLGFAQIDWSDPTDTEFDTGGNVVCTINGNEAKWIDGEQELDAMNNCFKSDGITSGGIPQTTCCPSGFSCNLGNFNCEPTVTVDSCADYTTKDACENYNPESIKDSIHDLGRGIVGGSVQDFCETPYEHNVNGECAVLSGPCECQWNNVKDECESNFIIAECTNTDPIITFCQTETSQIINRCDEPANIYEITWTSKLVDILGNEVEDDSNFCGSGSRSFPCPSTSRIPLFTITNALITVLAIGLIYGFVVRRRK